MDDILRQTIASLDSSASNFGFSQENFGLAEEIRKMHPAHRQAIANVLKEHAAVQGGAGPYSRHPMNTNGTQQTALSLNPAIGAKTFGKSTFMITVKVTRVGAGAGNPSNPVYFFGGESFNNSSTPYLQVNNGGQVVTLGTASGKNVVRITYGGGGNTTTYEISLGTAGEYPFILNSLVGTNKMQVHAIQTEISDALQQSQLSSEVETFYFNEFGKATTDDLTTPKDLYQQQNNGIFMPHEFEISGKRGMVTNINDVDGFICKFYFWATSFKSKD